jgi:hypothetical protein
MDGENVNKVFQFATVSKLRHFYVDIAFIIVIVDIYKMETIRFNNTSAEFLHCNRRKKVNSTF